MPQYVVPCVSGVFISASCSISAISAFIELIDLIYTRVIHHDIHIILHIILPPYSHSHYNNNIII